ncbi:MAG: DUF4304 domain-containing protein, partial [Bacteroidetes bacterium]|nr:DUF4304 domain-containing protein [Bacteroidota bacterium]
MIFRKVHPDIKYAHCFESKKEVLMDLKSKDLGLGWVNLKKEKFPTELNANDFSELTFKIYKECLEQFGFTHKNNTSIKDFGEYLGAVHFWRWRYGGGFQIELLIKYKSIKYPPKHNNVTQSYALKNYDFSRKLSPILTRTWVWPFRKENPNPIIEDISRIFQLYGIKYFEMFNNLSRVADELDKCQIKNDPYNSMVSVQHGFPSNFLDFELGMNQPVYFLFDFF